MFRERAREREKKKTSQGHARSSSLMILQGESLVGARPFDGIKKKKAQRCATSGIFL